MRMYRYLALLSLLYAVAALAGFVYGIAAGHMDKVNPLAGVFLLFGLIGLMAGIALRDLTERVEKLEGKARE